MGLPGFVIVGIGFWGCDLEVSSLIILSIFVAKTYFLPMLTAPIPEDLASVEMSVVVKEKGEDPIGPTSTLNT